MHGYENPERTHRILALFDAVWGDLSQRLELAATLGARWTEVSTPFVALEGSEVVAHAGVIAIPLVLDGTRTTVAGIHAVGTHPEHRGRGHIRRLLAEALAFCDQRFETAQLTTSVPDVFRPHGFRSMPQHLFRVAVPPEREGTALTPLRHTCAADVKLLWRLLRTRTPVSLCLGVVEPGWLFMIDEILAHRNLARVHYAPDLNVAVVFDVDRATSDTARIYDLVAPRLPRLDAVLHRLPASVRHAELYFTPDAMPTFLPLSRRGQEITSWSAVRMRPSVPASPSSCQRWPIAEGNCIRPSLPRRAHSRSVASICGRDAHDRWGRNAARQPPFRVQPSQHLHRSSGHPPEGCVHGLDRVIATIPAHRRAPV